VLRVGDLGQVVDEVEEDLLRGVLGVLVLPEDLPADVVDGVLVSPQEVLRTVRRRPGLVGVERVHSPYNDARRAIFTRNA
jgi:hypothetical protein